jgi:hypothetical protein
MSAGLDSRCAAGGLGQAGFRASGFPQAQPVPLRRPQDAAQPLVCAARHPRQPAARSPRCVAAAPSHQRRRRRRSAWLALGTTPTTP